jgi:hypothetical protein
MSRRIVDIRNRPTLFHNFHGAQRGAPEFAMARWIDGLTRLRDPDDFVLRRSAASRGNPKLQVVKHRGAFRYADVTLVPDMYTLRPGGRLYTEAANGPPDQLAFGSSHPYRAMRQSVDDYRQLGFRDDALDAARPLTI